MPPRRHVVDTEGNKEARHLIAAAKVAVPRAVAAVIDRAIQVHGAAGISDATPLAAMYGWHRAMRIFDGPDEVHRRAIARYRAHTPAVGRRCVRSRGSVGLAGATCGAGVSATASAGSATILRSSAASGALATWSRPPVLGRVHGAIRSRQQLSRSRPCSGYAAMPMEAVSRCRPHPSGIAMSRDRMRIPSATDLAPSASQS